MKKNQPIKRQNLCKINLKREKGKWLYKDNEKETQLQQGRDFLAENYQEVFFMAVHLKI